MEVQRRYNVSGIICDAWGPPFIEAGGDSRGLSGSEEAAASLQDASRYGRKRVLKSQGATGSIIVSPCLIGKHITGTIGGTAMMKQLQEHVDSFSLLPRYLQNGA